MKCTFKIKRVLTKKKDAKNIYRVFKATVSNVEFEPNEAHQIAVQKEMIIKGNMLSCVEGDTFSGTCKINIDPKWGVNLILENYELQKYETEDEVAKFFEKKIQGVGKASSKVIVEKLGVNAIDVIASPNGYNKLLNAKIPGIGVKKAETIRESVLFHKNFSEIVMFLQLNNLDVKMANVLYEEFGKSCLLDLKINPYRFAGYVPFEKLDDAGYKAGHQNISSDRIKGAIKGYIQMKLEDKGDVYVPVDEIKANLAEYMNRNKLFNPITCDLGNLVKQALLELGSEGNKSFRTSKGNIILDGSRVYRRDMYYLETRIATRLKEINIEDEFYDFELIDTIIDCEEAKSGFKLAEKQRKAVHMAMKHNFFVLCGLPGTGKTSTTNLILRVFRKACEVLEKSDKTLLMAPTGKASRRLSELCGEQAMTIHRALGIKIYEQPDLKEDIKADFIIVDESSMVDIYMFFTLLEKIKKGTKVMFIGDDEQLPSVGAGLVLRDLINADNIPSIKLTEVFRQAATSHIIHNSHAIIKSRTDFKFGSKGVKSDSFFTVSTADYRDMHNKIATHYIRCRDLGYSKDDVCILCPTKKGLFGTEAINKLIQTINPNKESIRVNGFDMKIGDKVMNNTNNYDMGVCNGEVGEVIDFKVNPNKRGGTITIKYPEKLIDDLTGEEYDKILTYAPSEFNQLELAYAITIHKSQGSEYRAVIFVCMEEHSRMLTKNLVYTGFTRAKELLSIIGQKEALVASADKKTEISRRSYLVERLNGGC